MAQRRTCEISLGVKCQHTTIVSACDYAALTKWRWNFKVSAWRYGSCVYARRGGGKQPTVLMHRYILEVLMGIPAPNDMATVHHRDKNSLNNTRDNLEWASKSKQSREQKPRLTKVERAEIDAQVAA